MGVRHLYVALDDIEPRLRHDRDLKEFPQDDPWVALAQAQASFLNKVLNDVVLPEGLAGLWTVPTRYNGTDEHPYKQAFGTTLDPRIRVQWTGEGVFSEQVTADQVQRAAHAYRVDDLVLWDNFPVNDDKKDRIFLTPYSGRDGGNGTCLSGITINPMVQPYASMPALAELGVLAWAPDRYDPSAVHAAALAEIAGPDPAARRAISTLDDLNQSWPYRGADVRAPRLSAALSQAGLCATSTASATDAVGTVLDTHPLTLRGAEAGHRDGRVDAYLSDVVRLPEDLGAVACSGFAADVLPWCLAAADLARAGREAIALLEAVGAGRAEDAARALIRMRDWYERACEPRVATIAEDFSTVPRDIVPAVGDGILDGLVQHAYHVWEQWAGLDSLRPPRPVPVLTVVTDLGSRADTPVTHVTDGAADTLWWSSMPVVEGSSLTADLGRTVEICRVRLRQGRSRDNHWHKFYHPDLELSQDGRTWTPVGAGSWVGELDVPVPAGTVARYVRVRARRPNPGAITAQVRSLEILSPPPGCTTTALTSPGSNHLSCGDPSASVPWRAHAYPGHDTLTLALQHPASAPSTVVVVGQGQGTLRARDTTGRWHDLVPLLPGRLWTEASLPHGTQIDAVGLKYLRGAVTITACGVRTPVSQPFAQPQERP